jgi:hypothetical protein
MKLRLLPLAGVIIALLAPAQHASANDGYLQFTAYTWEGEPGRGQQCATGIFQDLDLSFDANLVPGCPADGFLLENHRQHLQPRTRHHLHHPQR